MRIEEAFGYCCTSLRLEGAPMIQPPAGPVLLTGNLGSVRDSFQVAGNLLHASTQKLYATGSDTQQKVPRLQNTPQPRELTGLHASQGTNVRRICKRLKSWLH